MSVGPIYGVKLIDTLPVGGMLQQMPQRGDLEQVAKINQRTAAAYEVLLAHFYRLQQERDNLQSQLESINE